VISLDEKSKKGAMENLTKARKIRVQEFDDDFKE